MHSWPWRMIAFLGLALAFIYAATRSDPELSFVEQATPAQLIERLDHPREPVRRAAASQLVAQGAPVVSVMLEAIPKATDQQLAGIFFVLEDLYLSRDDEVFDAVEAALDTLSVEDEPSIKQSAKRILGLNAPRRHSRAYAKLVSVGAKFESTHPVPRFRTDHDFHGDLLILGTDWTGGPAELNVIHHMQHLHAVHIAHVASVSSEDILRLRNLMPFLMVRAEGEPCLGIECYLDKHELEVARVVPDSPADRGGLKRFDEIVELNGQSTRNATEFFEQLRQYSPGEEVVVGVLRNRKELTLTVKLDSDFGTARCRCGDQNEMPAGTPVVVDGGRQLHHLTDRILRPASYRFIRDR